MYQVFTDGSSSRKYGTIGTSYIVFKDKDSNPIKVFNKGFTDKQARNGIAELLGVYHFLYDLCDNGFIEENQDVVIYSDAQYVVNELTIWFRDQMMKNFFETKNKEIIIYILFMLHILREEYGLNIKFQWIKGHQKDRTFEVYGNNLADVLAVEARNQTYLENIEDFVSVVKNNIESEKTLDFVKKIYLGI